MGLCDAWWCVVIVCGCGGVWWSCVVVWWLHVVVGLFGVGTWVILVGVGVVMVGVNFFGGCSAWCVLTSGLEKCV